MLDLEVLYSTYKLISLHSKELMYPHEGVLKVSDFESLSVGFHIITNITVAALYKIITSAAILL